MRRVTVIVLAIFVCNLLYIYLGCSREEIDELMENGEIETKDGDNETPIHLEGKTNRWREPDPIFDLEKTWRFDFEGTLYAEPSTESEVVYNGLLKDVEIVDGYSIFSNYSHEDVPDISFGPSKMYIAWYRLSSGDVTGWTKKLPVNNAVDGKNEYPIAPEHIFSFKKDFSPLREKPDIISKPLRVSGGVEDEEAYPITYPNMTKGKPVNPVGRCEDWFCVRFGYYNSGWLQYNESTISLYRLVYERDLSVEMYAEMKLYFPVSEIINDAILITISYADDAGDFLANPVLAISAHNDESRNPFDHTYSWAPGVAHTTVEYYYVDLPTPVRRNEIEAITFFPGNMDGVYNEKERMYRIDPADIWGEFKE